MLWNEPWWLTGKESACNAGDQIWSLHQEHPLEKETATHSSILAWRIPMDRGAWRATVHGVIRSRTWWSIHILLHNFNTNIKNQEKNSYTAVSSNLDLFGFCQLGSQRVRHNWATNTQKNKNISLLCSLVWFVFSSPLLDLFPFISNLFNKRWKWTGSEDKAERRFFSSSESVIQWTRAGQIWITKGERDWWLTLRLVVLLTH